MILLRRISFILICLLLLAAFPLAAVPCPAEAADSWVLMADLMPNTLYAVWSSSNSDVFVTLDSGNIIHYNGTTWSNMSSGTSNTLFDLWGSSASDVFAVGNSGTILHYNGSAWSTMTSTTLENLNSAWGSSGSDVFAVGSNGTILHYNGSAWSTMTSTTSEQLYSVWGSSGSDIFAAGEASTIVHYNGSAWSTVTTGGGQSYRAVWGSSASDFFVASYEGNILHYNGSSWSTMVSGSSDLYTCMWGSSASDVFVGGWTGAITHYNGSSWIRTSVADAWNSIRGNCGQDVYAVGNDGYIMRYGNGCPPTITSFTPATGPAGTRIIITGTHFTGATAVSLGGMAAARFTVNSDSQITATVATGATGKVSITSPLGTGTSTANFTFIRPSTQNTGNPLIQIGGGSMGGTGSAATVQQSPILLSSISVKSASISAPKVAPGTPVTVTANVVNTGTANGTSSIKVYVNGEEESSQGVTVSSGSSTPVTFSISRNEPGTYSVYVGGTQAGSFTVDQFTPDTILYISGALVFFAFVTGAIIMTRRKV
jgi:hypothetical protein